MLYRVRYFYLATGMEGRPDERDYGLVEADSPEAAVEAIVLREEPDDKYYGAGGRYSNRDWLRGCLSAKPELLGQ